MHIDWKRLLLVMFLGIVLPWAIVAFIPRAVVSPQNNTGNTAPRETNAVETQPEAQKLLISVLMADGTITQMELDEYLTGVVLTEMPAEFETEALKAQAVVARTYAVKRHCSEGKHIAAAVCTESTCCQGFSSTDDYLRKGGNKADIEKIRQAVIATHNQVLTYKGNFIDATYFSCSGGKTESALAVWGSEIPYLQAVESPGEERASHYTDTVKFTREEFGDLLGADLTGYPETWIDVVSYTDGGGVESMCICGKEYKGTDLRTRLGLRSTAFTMTVVGSTITVTTKGYGHRVGMSQYGADAMAANGSTYPQILEYYYQGSKLDRLDN